MGLLVPRTSKIFPLSTSLLSLKPLSTYITSSSLAVKHTDHAGRLEAGAPARGTLSIRDNRHLSSLEGNRQATTSYNAINFNM